MARAQAPWSTAQRRIAWLVLPVVAISLTFAVVKVVERFPELTVRTGEMGTLSWLALLASPLLFLLGFGLICSGLLLASEGRRVGLLALAQLFALITLLDELASFSFYMRTSAPLRFEHVLYWLSRPADLRLVAAVITPLRWAGVFAAVLGLLLAPRLIRKSASGPQTYPRPRSFAIAALGVVVCIIGTLPLASYAADADSVRDPMLELFVSATHHRRPPTAPMSPIVLDVARTDDKPLPNVVIVLLESTRAISIKPWGALDTMPFLAALAEKSLRVDRAYTVIPHTSKALVAALCGLPPSHTLEALGVDTGILRRCLPALLESAGYQTAFFQSADPYFEGREQVVKEMGFDEFSGATKQNAGQYVRANFVGFEDDVMLDPSKRFLEGHMTAPKLAVYLTVAPHHECYPLKRYGRVEFSEDRSLNDYLNNVREEDFFIKNLIEQYKALGLYDHTIFIILGDHGEAFGEHGRRAHDDVPYEETLRIPLVVHDPSGLRAKPSVLPGPVSELDLVPTILDMLGMKITAGSLPGAPFGKRPPGSPIFAACFGERDCAVDLHGTRKLISFYGRRPDELYDLLRDPGERTNLAGPGTAAEVKQMNDELARWEASVHAFYWGKQPRAPSPSANR